MKIAALAILFAALGLCLGESDAVFAEGTAFVDTTAVEADTSLVFTLVSGSRLFPDWSEEQTVRLQEAFHIGDTGLMGVVTGFMPDFKIKNGKPYNWSAELNNPAALVHVFSDSATVDSVWAFLNFPPHFSPNSFYTFQLKAIEGYGDSPVLKEEK